MTRCPSFERILATLTRQIAPAVERDTDMHVSALAEWIRFQGFKSGGVVRAVAGQAALNLMLGLIIAREATAPVTGHTYLDQVVRTVTAGVGPDEVDEMIAELRACDEDVIGTAYTAIVAQEDRRRLGQFWTPRPIAQFMTAWAVRGAQDEVLDPG